MCRDDIKTGLHVSYRSNYPDEVWRFAERAFDVFFGVCDMYLDAGVSVVLEAAFHTHRSTPSLTSLARRASVVHLVVSTPTDVSLRRYRARAERGDRHPAHNDLTFAAQMEAGTKDIGVYQVALDSPSLFVDATDGYDPTLDQVVAFVHDNR